jgi:hypothetical protein
VPNHAQSPVKLTGLIRSMPIPPSSLGRMNPSPSQAGQKSNLNTRGTVGRPATHQDAEISILTGLTSCNLGEGPKRDLEALVKGSAKRPLNEH